MDGRWRRRYYSGLVDRRRLARLRTFLDPWAVVIVPNFYLVHAVAASLANKRVNLSRDVSQTVKV